MSLDRRGAGDGFVACACGGRHWGRFGAAGVLVHDRGRVLLQHRALFLQEGGTWALPGGALDVGESAVDGALREAREEVGVEPEALRPRHVWTVEHGTWRYSTVVVDAVAPVDARDLDGESLDVRWVPIADVPGMALHSGFAAGWASVRALVGLHEAVVVDVGSGPSLRQTGGEVTSCAVGRLDTDGLQEPSGLLTEVPGRTRAWPRWVCSVSRDLLGHVERLLASGWAVSVVTDDHDVAHRARSRGARVATRRRLADLAHEAPGRARQPWFTPSEPPGA